MQPTEVLSRKAPSVKRASGGAAHQAHLASVHRGHLLFTSGWHQRIFEAGAPCARSASPSRGARPGRATTTGSRRSSYAVCRQCSTESHDRPDRRRIRLAARLPVPATQRADCARGTQDGACLGRYCRPPSARLSGGQGRPVRDLSAAASTHGPNGSACGSPKRACGGTEQGQRARRQGRGATFCPVRLERTEVPLHGRGRSGGLHIPESGSDDTDRGRPAGARAGSGARMDLLFVAYTRAREALYAHHRIPTVCVRCHGSTRCEGPGVKAGIAVALVWYHSHPAIRNGCWQRRRTMSQCAAATPPTAGSRSRWRPTEQRQCRRPRPEPPTLRASWLCVPG